MVNRMKFLLLLLVLMSLGCSLLGRSSATPTPSPSTPTVEPGEWLTAPLTRDGDLLIYKGANLSNQVGAVKAHTYYSRGERVALTWEGYIEGASTWSITPEVKAEKPGWETNESWSVDFWWPAARGPYPEGSKPGTSSK